MASVAATSQAMGLSNFASGSFTGDGTATTITVGFKARAVKVVNSTDVIVWEKIEGMAAANTLKLVSHDTAQVNLDTNSAVVINDDGTISLSATLAANAKAISWVAFG